ncbi:MAG: divalent-cation tolerance protein CutA [Bdellovibrionales bacterium]|nr:divalent-cation tolerance protein CutA [Bdellovibrionales bacterium]
MNLNEFVFVYVTSPTLELAQHIARVAVERKQAACANIIPQMLSIYSWEGKLCEETEVVLILKTQGRQVSRLKETVLELHEYQCPCIVALPISEGHQPFLDWLKSQSSET